MAKKKPTQLPLPPVVRVAPLGELKAYTISEHELDRLERGSAVSDLLTIGYCLFSAAATIAAALFSAPMPDLTFILFVCSLIIFTLSGFICTLIGWKTKISAGELVKQIKGRMPGPPSIQEVETEKTGSSSLAPDASQASESRTEPVGK